MFYAETCLSGEFVLLKQTDLAGNDLIHLLFCTICCRIPGGPETSGNVYRSSFCQQFEVRHLAAVPCDDIMPRRFVDGPSVPGLVQMFGHKREVGDSGFSYDVCPDVSDTSLEFDTIDVFHKILSLFCCTSDLPTSYARFAG